jgi:hypothetical protein
MLKSSTAGRIERCQTSSRSWYLSFSTSLIGTPLSSNSSTTIGVLVVAFTLAYKGTVNWFFEGIVKWTSRPKKKQRTALQTKRQMKAVPATFFSDSHIESPKGEAGMRTWEMAAEGDLEAGRRRYSRQEMTQINGLDSATALSRRSTQFPAVKILQQGETLEMSTVRPRRAL